MIAPNEPLPDIGKFLLGVAASFNWTVAELRRHIAPRITYASFGRRLVDNDWLPSELVDLRKQLADLLKIEERSIWLYLTLGEHTHPLLEDLAAATRIWVARPDDVRTVSGVLQAYEAKAKRILCYTRFLGVSLQGPGIIEPHCREYFAKATTAGRSPVKTAIDLGLARAERFDKGAGFGSARDVIMMLFRSEFEDLPHGRWPFATCHPQMLWICVNNLIKNVVLGRGILIWLVEDRDPKFPQTFRDYFSRFDHLAAIDNRLVIFRWRNSADRGWFERGAPNPLVNPRIDREMEMLEELKNYVRYRTPSEIAEQLKRYLPE